jgi:hypothetical protein
MTYSSENEKGQGSLVTRDGTIEPELRMLSADCLFATITCRCLSPPSELYAATLFWMFTYDQDTSAWPCPVSPA